jgi:ADP-heptose:LPS heptosyltransferase
MTSGRERILFVELWRLGDAVAATAGLSALRQARPEAEIGVVAHSLHGEPLFRSPDADHRLPFDAFWTRGRLPRDKYLPWTIDYRELGRAARSIRAFRPNHVLLFRGDIREQLFFRSLGMSAITDLKGKLPTLPGIRTNRRPAGVPRWREYVFHVERWADTTVQAQPTIADVKRGAQGQPYVLVHPGASWRYKQWSAPRLAELLRWLQQRATTVRVVAGPSDHLFIDELRDACGADLVVEYPSLNDLYMLIADAQAVVCNNSAALHIAEALGTPCVALTGPSDPIRWGTYRSHSRTVTRALGLPCHPCGDKRCVLPEAPCIDRIELRDVVEALSELGIVARPGHVAVLQATRGHSGTAGSHDGAAVSPLR